MDFNTISLLIFGLTILIIGGNLLLKAAVSISMKFGIPKLLIGMTVVSLATSAPELIVSIKSAIKGSPDLAISNVLGSNIANLGLVLGITIIFSPINISKSIYKKEWPIMMFSAIYFLIVVLDGIITKIEGGILVCFLIMTIASLIKFRDKNEEHIELEDEDSVIKSLIILIFGGVFLFYGSEWFIDGAILLANSFGISERIIGITVVSVGTSIPELAASVVASIKKQNDLSIGNLIGSNIFNLLVVIGITSTVLPIEQIDSKIIFNDMLWVILFSAIILPLAYLKRRNILTRKKGIILLTLYLIFIIPLILS